MYYYLLGAVFLILAFGQYAFTMTPYHSTLYNIFVIGLGFGVLVMMLVQHLSKST